MLNRNPVFIVIGGMTRGLEWSSVLDFSGGRFKSLHTTEAAAVMLFLIPVEGRAQDFVNKMELLNTF